MSNRTTIQPSAKSFAILLGMCLGALIAFTGNASAQILRVSSITLTAAQTTPPSVCPATITFTGRVTVVATYPGSTMLPPKTEGKVSKQKLPTPTTPQDPSCATMLPPMTEGSTYLCCRFVRSDGATSPPQILHFTSAGTQTITMTWTRGAGSGWEQLVVLESPTAEFRSPQAPFTITCQ